MVIITVTVIVIVSMAYIHDFDADCGCDGERILCSVSLRVSVFITVTVSCRSTLRSFHFISRWTILTVSSLSSTIITSESLSVSVSTWSVVAVLSSYPRLVSCGVLHPVTCRQSTKVSISRMFFFIIIPPFCF